MKSRLPPQSTNALTQSILAYLRAKRFMAWRNNNGVMLGRYKYGCVGSADILALKDGKLYCIEVKRKDKLSEAQTEWLDDARRHGAVAIVARSLEDVQAVVK